MAVLAGLWALIGSQWVFPYLSDDHDEGIYLFQATALADGHLFPPAPEHADAFRPWLSVHSDDRFVLKYAPVHASILAVGIRTTGSARSSLALIAAGIVVLSYALAKEVLGDRRLAVLASVFLALSPLFLVQSATFLPYCSSLLLLEGFALAFLRGARSDGRVLLSVSGFVFGVALFARPFDALLWAIPLGLYVVVSQRTDRGRLARTVGWFGLGTVVPIVAMLSYYRAATGSPFRTPFNLLEPQDTLGFGARRLLPSQPELVFTPVHGTFGVIRYILLTSAWGFGGLVLVGLFLACVVRRRLDGPQPWLALVALSFSCGYLFFWGTFSTSPRGGITSFLGPFYFLPVLVPVTFLAAKCFGEVWHRDRVIAATAFAGMVVVSGYLLLKALPVNLRFTAEDRRLYAPIAAARLDRALVLIPPIYGPQLMHPFAYLQNEADYDGRIVYALDRGDPRNLELLDDLPGREAYKLRLRGHYRANPSDPGLTTSLERLTVTTHPSVPATLAFDNPTEDPYVAVTVTLNGRKDSFVLDRESVKGKRHEVAFSVGPSSVDVRAPVADRFHERAADVGLLSVSVAVRPADGGQSRTIYERHLACDSDGRSVRVLLPGNVSVNELGAEDPLEISGR